MELKVNSTLKAGKYRIEKVLGQGGFGITYLAEQSVTVKGEIGEIETKIKVTVKEFFMKELCDRNSDTSHVSVGSLGSRGLVDKFRVKFIKEAQSISNLKHNHIIKVLDVFEENGTAYYVMEYIEGGSLNDRVAQLGTMSEVEALHYIYQIADALKYIHAQKVNHLDVKPSNILIKKGAISILIDFGLAKHYDKDGGQTSTTPVGISKGYAPMEQYKVGGVSSFSPSSDIYSLGATLYKLVIGCTPPEAHDIYDSGLPKLPNGLSAGVRRAITAAMQPNRGSRPQSIEEFLAILQNGAGAGVAKDSEQTTIINKPKIKLTPREPQKIVEPKQKTTSKPTKGGNNRVVVGIVVALLVITGIFIFYPMLDDAEPTYYQSEPTVVINQDSLDRANAAVAQAEQERERIAKEQAAAEAKRKTDAAVRAKAQAEQERIAKEQAAEVAKAETARAEAAKAEAERVARERAEYEKMHPTSARAQNSLGEDYYYGRNGVAQSYNEAVKWYNKAAEQGFARSQYNLGTCYYSGLGVTHNFGEAVKWFLVAAGQGYAKAQNSLGICYYNGQGVPKNIDEAIRWFRRAAEQGDVEAKNNLEACSKKGDAAKNFGEAVKWIRKAAEQGAAISNHKKPAPGKR